MTNPTHPVDPGAVARARARLLQGAQAERITSVLTLIADPTRMRLLFALDAAEELCVGDLALATGATEDAVGYALRMLRTAGLVRRRKEGRLVFYSLAEGFPEPLREHCLVQLAELARARTPDA